MSFTHKCGAKYRAYVPEKCWKCGKIIRWGDLSKWERFQIDVDRFLKKQFPNFTIKSK